MAFTFCCVALPAWLALGCGAAPPPQPPPERPQKTGERTTVTVEAVEPAQPSAEAKKPAPDPRILPAGADFGQLVQAAGRAEDSGLHLSGSDCLLSGTGAQGQGWELEADLAAAVRPLPSAPSDLEKRLRQKPARAHVLTRWGRIGEEPFDIALVAFTTTTPESVRLPAVALFLTEAGIFVRQSDRVSDRFAEPYGLNELGPLLAERAASGPFVVYVTAGDKVALQSVRELLSYLPEKDNEVALAAPLAAGTRLPAAPEPSAQDRSIWCPDGLPRPPKRSAVGGMSAQAVKKALEPLAPEAQKCMASASGEAAAGGKVDLAIRIAEGGEVRKICLTRDEISSSSLAKCLLETVRAISFPAPQPPGLVDIHLPLRLAPIGFNRQRPLCH